MKSNVKYSHSQFCKKNRKTDLFRCHFSFSFISFLREKMHLCIHTLVESWSLQYHFMRYCSRNYFQLVQSYACSTSSTLLSCSFFFFFILLPVPFHIFFPCLSFLLQLAVPISQGKNWFLEEKDRAQLFALLCVFLHKCVNTVLASTLTGIHCIFVFP